MSAHLSKMLDTNCIEEEDPNGIIRTDYNLLLRYLHSRFKRRVKMTDRG
jgi:hypothetical protein